MARRNESRRGAAYNERNVNPRNTPDYRSEANREPFTCKVCGTLNLPDDAGTLHRNHCARCLSSVHVDNHPGDRASLCGGVMEPVGVWVRGGGEWALIHRCKSCGHLSSNRIAADDNPLLLMSIAVRPLANPPFPLSILENQSTWGGQEADSHINGG